MLVSKPGRLSGKLLLKRAAAELLGTYGMVFAGTGAIMIDSLSGGKVTHLGIGITFGLIVAAMIFTFGSISGAHINPAVTVAFTITRRLRWTVAACYIPAQLAGGILASLTLYYLLGPTASMGATLPAGSDTQSLVLEIILTFILMAIIMSLSLEPRIAGPVAALAIGGNGGPGSHIRRAHLRGFHEPGPFPGPGAGGMGLARPLGLLGRPDNRRYPGSSDHLLAERRQHCEG